MTRWESIVCVHQPVRVSVCAWLFFSFLSLSSRWRILRGGGRAGGTGGWVGRNMKRSLVHSLFSLSLSLSLVCVCFVFLRERLRPKGQVRWNSSLSLSTVGIRSSFSFFFGSFAIGRRAQRESWRESRMPPSGRSAHMSRSAFERGFRDNKPERIRNRKPVMSSCCVGANNRADLMVYV